MIPARDRLTNAVEERPLRAIPAAALYAVARVAVRTAGRLVDDVPDALLRTAGQLLDVPPELIVEAGLEKARTKRGAAAGYGCCGAAAAATHVTPSLSSVLKGWS